MKISIKAKGIIKKVALVLAGVMALTAVGFGVKAIVDYTKEDLKTISPNFEVGSLGSDGKYVKDEGTLYTKEAFGCYGLQVKPDFDSSVNYQIFYYDILDNYISSTSSLSDGFSGEAPVNGAYARMVIEPKNDKDGKISLTERVSYPKQITVKVKKEQNIGNRFTVLDGKVMQIVSGFDKLIFVNGLVLGDNSLLWVNNQYYCATSTTVLSVDGGSTLSFNFSKLGEFASESFCRVYEFSGLPLADNLLVHNSTSFDFVNPEKNSVILDKNTKYVVLCVGNNSQHAWAAGELSIMPSCFSITKTN